MTELRLQRTASQEAERAATAAQAQLETTRVERVRAQTELAAATAQLRGAAIAGYVRSDADSQLDALFGDGPRDAAVQGVLSRTVVRSTGDALDQRRAAATRLARAETAAVQAEAAAAARATEAQTQLSDLNGAYDQQTQLLESVATRLDTLLSESASLTAQDVDLPAQLDIRQQELITQAAAAAQAAEAARQEASARRDGWADPPTTPAVSETRTGYHVPIATVGGIEVHADIAGQLGAMIGGAAADGITLSGGGWRSSDEQVAIRREVCGTSDYAIWEMPSWECSPPVARLGRSMHEQGLAIDFTAGGDLVRSRSHPSSSGSTPTLPATASTTSPASPGTGRPQAPDQDLRWMTPGRGTEAAYSWTSLDSCYNGVTMRRTTWLT